MKHYLQSFPHILYPLTIDELNSNPHRNRKFYPCPLALNYCIILSDALFPSAAVIKLSHAVWQGRLHEGNTFYSHQILDGSRCVDVDTHLRLTILLVPRNRVRAVALPPKTSHQRERQSPQSRPEPRECQSDSAYRYTGRRQEITFDTQSNFTVPRTCPWWRIPRFRRLSKTMRPPFPLAPKQLFVKADVT